MCVCQGVINPGPSSIHYSKWGEKAENRHVSHFSFSPDICLFSLFFALPATSLPGFHPLLPNTHFIFSFTFFFFSFSCSARRPYHFSRGAPTSLKLWWMALAPVSISKLKQFKDKTSRSLSYRFSELGLRWHLVSEGIREWKHRWTHTTF